MIDSSAKYVTNIYPITLAPGTRLSYRIWTVDPIPSTDTLKEKIRTYLWQKRLKRPVALRYINGTFCYAVADWGSTETVEYVGEGERLYTIIPSDDIRFIDFNNPDTNEIDLAIAMIQQEMVLHLRNNNQLIRGHYGPQFYFIQPDIANTKHHIQHGRTSHSQSIKVDIYRGFNFRVSYFEDIGLCVVADILTSYISRETLASYLRQNKNHQYIEASQNFNRWVNDYGFIKQSVYLVRPLTKTIGEVILRDGRTTYDYLCEKYPSIRSSLSKQDRAATIVYNLADIDNESKHYTAASSFLKPKLTNQSRDVRQTGDIPAFPPHNRLQRIQNLQPYFRGIRFAGKQVSLQSLFSLDEQLFSVPDLVFGGETKSANLSANMQNQDQGTIRRQLGKQKLDFLKEHGPYKIAKFINPCFIYPASLESEDIFELFIDSTKRFCEEYGKSLFNPRLLSYRDEANAREILDKIVSIASDGRTGFILLALPNDATKADQVYTGIKTRSSIPSKCFSTNKVRSLLQYPSKLSSYLERNALGMLVENGCRPWGIANTLSYEMHFGFDVARTRQGALMGAAVITGSAACNIEFAYESMMSAEKIPAQTIGKFVLKHLEQFTRTFGRAPQSILFQRDGRLLEAERKGIRNALEKFSKSHPDQNKPVWAAISIEKTISIPLRMFRKNGSRIEQPFSGSYIIQNPTIGYLVLAGAPTLRQGTPRPLRIEIIDKSANNVGSIEDVLRDIFYLSRLNWNSPDIDISLPISLRFTDQKLERYSLEAEEDDQDDDWEELDSELNIDD